MEDHDRPVLDGQPTKPSLQLVAVPDPGEVVDGRTFDWQDPKVRRPTPVRTPLGIAGADEDAIRPRLEPLRIAKPRQLAPDLEERLLRRVFGEVGLAEDPLGDRVEPVAHGDG